MNRRLLLAGLAGAPLWGGAIRVSRYDGTPEIVDPSRHRATALLFLSTVCPISNVYQDRIRGLIDSTAGQPVRWVLLDSNDNESAADARQYAADIGLPVPLYKDWLNVIADRFRASVTPEAVALDAQGAVRYRGAIDDARNAARVKVESLRLAIAALVEGKPVEVPAIRAFGCAIKKVKS